MSDSVRPHRWQPIRLPRPWNSPGKNTGVGCHFLLHMTNLDSMLKSRDLTLPSEVYLVKAMVFPVSHVWMWELNHKEGWASKNWCFWIVVLKKTYVASTLGQSYGFSSSHVWMWKLDYKQGWVPKNWCFRIVVLEKTLECSLGCTEIKPINSKGNQPWIFSGGIDAEAKAPILWLPHVKSQLIRKDPDTGKNWRRRRRGWQKMRWLDASPTQWTWVWANSER